MNEEQLRRLSDCEILINKYHDQLAKYINQINNFEKNIVTREQFQKDQEVLKNSIQKKIDDIGIKLTVIKNDIQSIVKQKNDLNKLVDVHHSNLQIHNKNLDKLNNIAETSSIMHSNLDRKVNGIEQKLPNKEKIAQEFNDLRQNLFKLYGEGQKDQDDLRKQQQQQDHDIRSFQSRMESMKGSYENLYNQAEKELGRLFKELESLRYQTNNDREDLKIYIDKVVSNIPKPEKIDISEYKQLFQEQEHKITILNQALEKTKFNELQIIVLNKKVEKILEIIKNNGIK